MRFLIMRRVEFTVTGQGGKCLREPGFIEDCSDLPVLVMRAVEDFLEAHDGQFDLPITIYVRPAAGAPARQAI
jgi:hypothetical protein